jgi:MerR family glutamine synthetase transcriptional repressor
MTEINTDTPVYSIGVVKEMTGLTRRQIRYYEEEDLVKPARTKGNQRIYSQDDINRLEKIKELLENGLNIAGIQEQLGKVSDKERKKEVDEEPISDIGIGKKELTSLYPVSNRADLVRMLRESSELDNE